MIPARVDVFGSSISRCDMAGALAQVDQRLANGGGGYVCFTNVHSAVTGRQDERFRAVTNGSFLSVADGKGVVWAGHAVGAADLGHVPGPDFMERALAQFHDRRHYFYGSRPEVLDALVRELKSRHPGLNVCGAYSPPFRPASDAERREDYQRIRASGAEFVWVGLGAPKQEFWMAEAAGSVGPAILFGVGAAFDFHAGTLRRAPAWMRRVGLEWYYRLIQEPRRLWKRYLITNSLFLAFLLRQIVRRRWTGTTHD